MPDPYKTQVYDALVDLFEARAQLAALLNTNIQQTRTGWLKQRIRTDPNSFPALRLSNGRFTHSGYTVPGETYASESATDANSLQYRLVRRRCEFVATITTRSAGDGETLNSIEEEIQNALLLAGPILGLSFVKQWGAVSASAQREVNVANQSRLQSNITIPVLLEFSGSELLTALA